MGIDAEEADYLALLHLLAEKGRDGPLAEAIAEFRRFVKGAVAAEREACAKAADAVAHEYDPQDGSYVAEKYERMAMGAWEAAAAIRARGQ